VIKIRSAMAKPKLVPLIGDRVAMPRLPKSEERGGLVLVLPALSCDNSNTLAE
jgi:hypothetical protein